MIVVNNTKELELKYDLDKIPDEEKIVVLGGLAGKEKYNTEIYRRRVTYPARQIKQIINQMKEIEDSIPKEWNQWQRAKYIYEVLGNNISYNHNREDYKGQQSSNLTVLLSKKGICAGYALLFKEMMDRQSIRCDYFRGRATTARGKTEKHAWNVLQIDGSVFPVDLTWDASNLQLGIGNLEYFGCKENFCQTHIPDSDERKYAYRNLSREFVNSIDTRKNRRQNEFPGENKKNIMQFAFEETYKKFEMSDNPEIAKRRIENSIFNYIKEGKLTGFTRQNDARMNIEKNITQEDMLDMLIDEYVKNLDKDCKEKKIIHDVVSAAVQETNNKYGIEFAKGALKKYIKHNDPRSFTGQNDARKNIVAFMSSEKALRIIVNDFVQKEFRSIDKTIKVQRKNKDEIMKIYFDGGEFAKVQLPKENEAELIKRTMKWIKTKTSERQESIDTEKENKEEVIGNIEKKQQNER